MSMLYVGIAGIIKKEMLEQVMCPPNKGAGIFRMRRDTFSDKTSNHHNS